jgi:hypothetical protein
MLKGYQVLLQERISNPVAVLSVYVTPLYIVRVACASGTFLSHQSGISCPAQYPCGVHKKDLQKRKSQKTEALGGSFWGAFK